MQHPDERQLAAFLEGRLSGQEQTSVEQHVATCESCCEVLSQLPSDTLSDRLQNCDTAAFGLPGTPAATGPESLPNIPAALIDHPRYRILEPLGEGGMGVVFKAQHRMMDREVAIKVINAKLVDHPQAVERFRAEVRAAGKLSHPNIVRAYDAEQADDLHCLVMEYVDGVSLAELVRRNGPLPFRQAVAIVRKVAHGLNHAFRQGMVHRDIKPQNIMVTSSGKVRILDFGLARLVREREPEATDASADRLRWTADALTQLGSVLGTPDYIAPEQVEDARQADTRSDIYSLGCTLYFLLTSRPPFASSRGIMDKLVAHTNETPKPLTVLREGVPPKLNALVAEMMARSPDDRFQTPIDVANACDAFLNTAGSQVPTLSGAGATLEQQQPQLMALGQPPAFDIPSAELEPLPPRRNRKKKPRRPIRGLNFRALSAAIAGTVILCVGLWTKFGNKQPAPDNIPDPPTAEHQETRSSLAGTWIDLLGTASPRTAPAGTWLRSGPELEVNAATWARLALRPNVPREYDFEVTFTRQSGRHSVAIIFSVDGHQATLDIDAWGENLAGIQNINGDDVRSPSNPTRSEDHQLTNGNKYSVLISVRRGGVRAYVDGRQLPSYIGDGSNLSLLRQWDLGNANAIGIGAYDSATTFHTARLRER